MQLKLLLPDSSIHTVNVEVANAPPWALDVSEEIDGRKRFEAGNLFEALKDLRRAAEACGRKVLCKGSREDVVLSRLQSGSGGRAGYLVELGKQATLENTVDIFETESEENVVSVAKQEEFRKQWFDSLN